MPGCCLSAHIESVEFIGSIRGSACSLFANQFTIDIEELGSFDLPQNDGFFSKVTSAIKASQAKSEVVKEKFYELVKRRADIIESLVHLTILYAALFVFQVIVIPVFMLWIMLKIIKQVLNSSFSPKNQLIPITN